VNQPASLHGCPADTIALLDEQPYQATYLMHLCANAIPFSLQWIFEYGAEFLEPGPMPVELHHVSRATFWRSSTRRTCCSNSFMETLTLSE